jgi:ArsR family transcriptional regulator, virulence genes transcriptional regulator
MAGRKTLLRGIDAGVLKRAAEIIKLVGHPERLKIVEALEGGERTVGALCELCDLEQAICSQHLSRLREKGVVASRRDGLHVIYRLIEPKVPMILECIRKCDVPRS